MSTPKGMKGLAILIGHGKPGNDEENGPSSAESDSSKEEDDFLDQAMSALKDDDGEAFRTAMKGAMRACYDNEQNQEGE